MRLAQFLRFAFHYAWHLLFPVRRGGREFEAGYEVRRASPEARRALLSANRCIACGLCNAAEVVLFYARSAHHGEVLLHAPDVPPGADCPYGVDLPGLRAAVAELQRGLGEVSSPDGPR